jgi:hypothetical protein
MMTKTSKCQFDPTRKNSTQKDHFIPQNRYDYPISLVLPRSSSESGNRNQQEMNHQFGGGKSDSAKSRPKKPRNYRENGTSSEPRQK